MFHDYEHDGSDHVIVSEGRGVKVCVVLDTSWMALFFLFMSFDHVNLHDCLSSVVQLVSALRLVS